MDIGFIGVGVMGRAMATNLVKHRHRVTVLDRSPEAMRYMQEHGAIAADTISALAAASDVIITMLPTPEAIESVILGPGGLAEAMRPGTVCIDSSTGEPQLAQRIHTLLKSNGVKSLDCPVGGQQPEAVAGTLTFMAAGDSADIEQARPILLCMGDEVIECGGAGAGQATKLVNNVLAAVILQATTEAVSLGLKAGLRFDLMRDVMMRTMARNGWLESGLNKAINRDFRPGFTINLLRKDMLLATGLAARLDVPTPLTAALQQTCTALIAAGRGTQDVGAIFGAQIELLGLEP